MESKRTTRASSQDVSTRRGTRKSPGRKRSPSPIVEESVSPKGRARGRPKSASRNESKAVPKSPAKKQATQKTEKDKESKQSPPSPQKKSPRGRPAKTTTTTTTASTISSTSTTKTLTLSASAELKNRIRASMTPMTRSVSRSMSRSVYDREFSDTEENDRPSSVSFDRRSMSRQPQDRILRFGTAGAILLLVTMITLTLGVTLTCSSTACEPTLAAFKRLLLKCSTWYDAQATAVSVLFVAAITLVSALPTGRVVEIPRDEDDFKTYTFNGFATCVLALIALFCSDQTNGLQFVYRHYAHLCILSILTAVIVAAAAFLRSRFQPAESLNAYARTQKPICDLIVGREVNPIWFDRIDAKLVFYRISVITTMLINVVFLTKTIVLPPTLPLDQLNATSVLAFVTGIRADAATTAAASMVVVYCLDLLIFEHHLTSSFDIQCEGFGALALLRYAIFPFMMSTVPKFVLENATRAPWWIISVMATVFLSGLVMKRCADRIKYGYRMNAQDPRFESKSTFVCFY